ncbi:hypothetical protein AB0F07_23650 [Streptomyces fructofermentans]|uniref:hypothetical protein n=1 Tax=Streptomyces fructofermentans TaxID=152141 RepID=UPI0033E12200
MGPHIRQIRRARSARRNRHARYVRDCRTALVAALASALLGPAPAASASAASPRIPTGTTRRRVPVGPTAWQAPVDTADRFAPIDIPVCHAPHPGDPAARLARDIRAAMSAEDGTISVALRDDAGPSCELAAERQDDSSGPAGTPVGEGLLWRVGHLGRRLTGRATAYPRPTIAGADDETVWRLWADLAHSYLSGFLAAVRTRAATFGPGGHRTLASSTGADRLRLGTP